MNLDLSGKVAMVCGSTQGIGKSAALQLSRMGATIVLVARNEEKLKSVESELEVNNDQNHTHIQADFSNPSEVESKVNAFVAANGPVHILVNNTGGPAGGPAINAGMDEYLNAFNQHLINNHLIAQAVIEGMKTEGYGRIINVISTSVKQPLNGLGVSNTIRGAVANWAKTVANEVASHGVTVNNVLPGATNTIRLQSIIENKAAKTGKSIDEVSEAMVSEIPAKRFAAPEEIANAISFLASPAAGYINGINVPVDGGRTKCL